MEKMEKINNKEKTEKLIELTKNILKIQEDEVNEYGENCKVIEYKYLDKIKNQNIILVMGMNPSRKEALDENHILQLGYLPIDEANKEEIELKKILKQEMLYTKYMKPNYELFDNAKLWWALYEPEEILKRIKIAINENKIKNPKNIDIEKVFMNIYNRENEIKNKNIIIRTDLLYYHQGTQKVLENMLNEKYPEGKDQKRKELLDKIKEMINLHIDIYKPKMIVITNAFVSNLVRESIIGDDMVTNIQYEYHNKLVSIVFSGMVSGVRSLDNYAYLRLKKEIKEILDKD